MVDVIGGLAKKLIYKKNNLRTYKKVNGRKRVYELVKNVRKKKIANGKK